MQGSEHKLLTPLELKVMNILWRLKKGVVKDIIAQWPERPLPKYNTVSTIVRILEEKDYVGHDTQGRSHCYYPIVSKGKYQQKLMKNVLDNAFSGSLTGLISTLLQDDKLTNDQIEELRKLIDDQETI